MEQWLGLDRPFLEHELREAARVMHGDTGEGKMAQTCVIGADGTDESTWVEGFPAEFGGPVTARTLPGTTRRVVPSIALAHTYVSRRTDKC